MSHTAKSTTDHAKIRGWVEARGGRPATVAGTENGGDAGILRIDYPGYGDDDALSEISWESFFEKFEDSRLAFLYDDAPDSRFSKLVRREGHPAER